MKRPHKKKPKANSKLILRRKFRGFDNTKDIESVLVKQKLMQDVLGLSPERLGKLFEQAVQLLQQHHYDDAIRAFQFLTKVNPYVCDFWLGLGICQQSNGDSKDALESFLVAQTMDAERLELYPAAVDCCLELGNPLLATKLLDQSLKIAEKTLKGDELEEFLRDMKMRKVELEAFRSNPKGP
jgi:tetratricopeptide (TPR) repeat protein